MGALMKELLASLLLSVEIFERKIRPGFIQINPDEFIERIMGKNQSGNRQIQGRIVRLKMVDGTLVNGQVNIDREEGYDRLSDLVSSRQEPFLILFDVTLYRTTLENPEKLKTLFVNKNHIIWAVPDEDQK